MTVTQNYYMPPDPRLVEAKAQTDLLSQVIDLLTDIRDLLKPVNIGVQQYYTVNTTPPVREGHIDLGGYL